MARYFAGYCRLMNLETYTYKTIGLKQYKFVSVGKKKIIKLVQFKPVINGNIINMGFGDQLADGSIDDTSVSDNGDMVKVFATVIRIAYDFSGKFPHVKIAFTGSTARRTNLYNRILKMHYAEFSNEFTITGLIEKNGAMTEVYFDPEIPEKYLAFFIERKT
jgi:hypothetical protein